MKHLTNSIIEKIKKEEEISPFLFIGQNMELTHSDINNLALTILEYFGVPKTFLYHFENSGENIKIKEIQAFITKIHIKSSYTLQIFFIENIQNLTPSAANSLLKILEEPGTGNLIFLSTDSENSILETILSRVQVTTLESGSHTKEDAFYQDMIRSYHQGTSYELVTYFFANKLEKNEYIDFLQNIILYAKKHLVFIKYLEELNSDISTVAKNNVNGKYVVDKWILKIR